MKTVRFLQITSLIVTYLLVATVAQAALHDRGGGLIYDDYQNITWLSDANFAQTSGYDSDGLMNWADANAWANNLIYFDTVRGIAHHNGQLASAYDWYLMDVCEGFNCAFSEIGHLFYVDLGGTAGSSVLASGDVDLAKFSNIQAYVYWTGTQANHPQEAWVFGMDLGDQIATNKSDEYYAWAVFPGDVAAVPEADEWAMLLAGLGMVGVAARWRRG